MKSDFVRVLLAAGLACSCNAAANTFWKFHFMKQPLRICSLKDLSILALSPFVLIGVVLYMLSMLLFFYMLSNFKLSIIVPLTSLTYVLNFVAAFAIFHERLFLQNLVGTAIVLIGIVILSQTPLK